MGAVKTYSPKNEARITCPVFGAETRLADCFALEFEVMRGKQPAERRGCQACMRSSKCPVFWINREISRGADPYHASEPKLVSLSSTVLGQIAPIVVRDHDVIALSVEGEELDAIRAVNEAASAGAKSARGRKAPAVKLGAVTRSEPDERDDVTRAAMSGDMSAAITRAVKSEPVKSEPAEPAPKPAAKVETPAPKPAPAPKPVPASKPKAATAPAPAGQGMSLLERARARAAQNAA